MPNKKDLGRKNTKTTRMRWLNGINIHMKSENLVPNFCVMVLLFDRMEKVTSEMEENSKAVKANVVSCQQTGQMNATYILNEVSCADDSTDKVLWMESSSLDVMSTRKQVETTSSVTRDEILIEELYVDDWTEFESPDCITENEDKTQFYDDHTQPYKSSSSKCFATNVIPETLMHEICKESAENHLEQELEDIHQQRYYRELLF